MNKLCSRYRTTQFYTIRSEKATFNVPNFIEHVPYYSGSVSVGTRGDGYVPNITGSINEFLTASNSPFATGAFTITRLPTVTQNITSVPNQIRFLMNFNASNVSSVYADINQVVPAFAACLFCIRY